MYMLTLDCLRSTGLVVDLSNRRKGPSKDVDESMSVRVPCGRAADDEMRICSFVRARR